MARDDSDLEEIARELRKAHGCHTIILYGSRAKRTHSASSDYDLIAFRDAGPLVRDARPWTKKSGEGEGGAFLDVWIYPESAARAPNEEFLRALEGVVLCEKGSLGRDFLAEIAALAAAGPTPLAADDVALHRAWTSKMLQRIREGGPEDALAGYRRVWLIYELLPQYFALRHRWYKGPKESVAWLEKHDPRAHEALREAVRPGAGMAELERLVEVVNEIDQTGQG